MKKDKNRKLHGSVLLTVVFVMAILIVFLFGTMSLAIAANNRSHVNYSSAQTQITARAVAESAIEAVANNSDTGKAYAEAVGGLEAGMTPIEVGVELQGANVGTMGNVSNVTISHVGMTRFFDHISQEWEDRDVLKFTASVDMAGVQSTSSVYVVKYLEKDMKSAATGGAGFVTTAGANLKTQTSIFGGAYIGLPTEEEAANYVYTGSYEERVATRPFYRGGVENNIPANPDDPSSPGRFYTLNEGAVIEADLVVNNDMFVENWSGFVFPGKSTGITVWGDLQFHNNAKSHLNYIMENDITNDIKFNEVPYIYVDGRILGSPVGDVGVVKLGNSTQTFPLNTFCASIEATNTTGIINSSIYCMDQELTSNIKGTDVTALYSWTDALAHKVESTGRNASIRGEVCSKGNLTLENVKINGDVRVEGTLEIVGDNVTINGNVAAGKIEFRGANKIKGHNTIYCDAAAPGAAGDVVGEFKNQIGFYYMYAPVLQAEGEYQGKYTTKDGKLLNDSVFDNGMPREGYSPSELVIYQTLEEGWIYSIPEAEKHFTKSSTDVNNPYVENQDYYYSVNGTPSEELKKYLAEHKDAEDAYLKHLRADEGYYPDEIAGFYVKTEAVDISLAGGPERGFETINIDGKEYKFRYRTEYTKVEGATFEQEIVVGGGRPGPGGRPEDEVRYNPLEDFYNIVGETSIYPEYAEREALLGINGYGEDTKIVRTLEEVLTEVANPYKDAQLPSDQGADVIYEELKSGTGTVYTGDYLDEAVTIKESCIIDRASFYNGVTLDPSECEKSMVVVIRGYVNIYNNDLIVDDSSSKKVYIYIENGGTLKLHTGKLLTNTYRTLLGNSSLGYNSTKGVDIKSVAPKHVPNVFVYGESGGTFDLGNCNVITAYVKSPYISALVSGSGSSGPTSFYYNNYDVMGKGHKELIIGCFNVQNVTSDNPVNVVYIPEGDGGDGGIIDTGNVFWYKPYYYSEF